MSYGYGGNRRSRRKSRILLILAILLLLGGVALLLVDPIKNYMRNKKVDEAISLIQSAIPDNNGNGADGSGNGNGSGDSADGQNSSLESEPVVVTMRVPKDGNEVDGEDYDYFGENEIENAQISSMIDDAYQELPDYVTLTAIGLLDIDSVNIHIPIWNEASTVSLRYGGGHYESSVLPGQEGNCSILAHHMRTESMFHNLDQVETGDIIRITAVDGTIYNYVADLILIVSAEELPDYLDGSITDTKQITLVTCTYTSTGKMRLLVIGHLE